MVRSVDLARHMGFSKPGISHAVGVLRNGGFLTMDVDEKTAELEACQIEHAISEETFRKLKEHLS